MSSEEFVPSDVWLSELLERYEPETSARGVLVHAELDERFQMRRDSDSADAIDTLLRFAFSTIPDGCEIFLASVRSDSSVAALGCGTLTLRWQVTGNELPITRGNVRPLRPVTGGAMAHMRSNAARRVEAVFEGVGAELVLSAAEGDRELWARVELGR